MLRHAGSTPPMQTGHHKPPWFHPVIYQHRGVVILLLQATFPRCKDENKHWNVCSIPSGYRYLERHTPHLIYECRLSPIGDICLTCTTNHIMECGCTVFITKPSLNQLPAKASQTPLSSIRMKRERMKKPTLLHENNHEVKQCRNIIL